MLQPRDAPRISRAAAPPLEAMSVVEDDSKLEKLKLAPNAEMQEDAPLTAEEEKHLAEAIVAKLRAPASPPGGRSPRAPRARDAAPQRSSAHVPRSRRARRASPRRRRRTDPEKTMAALDETSRIRIYRGMITNNKGTMKEKEAEAVETYQRIGAWVLANGDVLTKKLKGEDVLNGAMNTLIGGQDYYGHQVWAERLGDIAGVVDHPVSPDEAKLIRVEQRPVAVSRDVDRENEETSSPSCSVGMKTMEAVRAAQIVASEKRGPRRYKQVYIIDLSQCSLSSLMARTSVRTMTTAIITGANNFYPECLYKMFIVNAPFIFRSVYTIISPFIHPVTKEKINILGGPSKYLPEMAKAGVPKAAVPKTLGGDCPDKKIDALLAELVADGFPRAAKSTTAAAPAASAAAPAAFAYEAPPDAAKAA